MSKVINSHTTETLLFDCGNHQTVRYKFKYCVAIDKINNKIVCPSNNNSFSRLNFGMLMCIGCDTKPFDTDSRLKK